MDWFAVISHGTYPTPGSTGAQRAIFAASLGLLDTAPVTTGVKKILKIIGSCFKKFIG